MFASEVLSEVLYQQLKGIPVLAGMKGPIGTEILPDRPSQPTVFFLVELASYTDPIGRRETGPGDLSKATCRVTIGLMCEGDSTNPIRDGAFAQLLHFDGLELTPEIEGTSYYIGFSANSEYLPTTIPIETGLYRRLGTTYDVEIVVSP